MTDVDKCVVCFEQKEGKPLYKKLESTKYEVDVYMALKQLGLSDDLIEEDSLTHYICWECDESVIDAYEQYATNQQVQKESKKSKKSSQPPKKAKKAPKPLTPAKLAEQKRKEEQRYYASHCLLCSCSFESPKGYLRFNLAKAIGNGCNVAKMLSDLKLSKRIEPALQSKRSICCNCFNTTRRTYRAFLKNGVVPEKETPKAPFVNHKESLPIGKATTVAEHAAEIAKLLPPGLANTYKILGYTNENNNNNTSQVKPTNGLKNSSKVKKKAKTSVKKVTSRVKPPVTHTKLKNSPNVNGINKTVATLQPIPKPIDKVSKSNRVRRLSETSSSSSSSSSSSDSSDSSSSESEDEDASNTKPKPVKTGPIVNPRDINTNEVKPNASSSSSSNSSDSSSESDEEKSIDLPPVKRKPLNGTRVKLKNRDSKINGHKSPPKTETQSEDYCVICARKYVEKPLDWWKSLQSHIQGIPGVSIRLALQYIHAPLAKLPSKVLKKELLCDVCYKTVSNGFRNQVLKKVADSKGVAVADIDVDKFKVRRLDEEEKGEESDQEDTQPNINDSEKDKERRKRSKDRHENSPIQMKPRSKKEDSKSPEKNSYKRKFLNYLNKSDKVSSEAESAQSLRKSRKRHKQDSSDDEYVPHKKFQPLIAIPDLHKTFSDSNGPQQTEYMKHLPGKYGIDKEITVKLKDIGSSLPSKECAPVSAKAIGNLAEECCGVCALPIIITDSSNEAVLTENSLVSPPNIPIIFKWARLSVGISATLDSNKLCEGCADNIRSKFLSFLCEKVAESQEMSAAEIDLKNYRIAFNEDCMNIVADQIEETEEKNAENKETEEKKSENKDVIDENVKVKRVNKGRPKSKRKQFDKRIEDIKMECEEEEKEAEETALPPVVYNPNKRQKLCDDICSSFSKVSDKSSVDKVNYLEEIWKCISLDSLMTTSMKEGSKLKIDSHISVSPGLITLLYHYCKHLNCSESYLTLWVKRLTKETLSLAQIKKLVVDASYDLSADEVVNMFVGSSMSDSDRLSFRMKEIDRIKDIDIEDPFSWTCYLVNIRVPSLLDNAPHKKLLRSEFTNGVLYGLWRICQLMHLPNTTLRSWLVKLSPLQLTEAVLDKLVNAVEMMHKHIQTLPEHITQLGVPIFSFNNKKSNGEHSKCETNNVKDSSGTRTKVNKQSNKANPNEIGLKPNIKKDE